VAESRPSRGYSSDPQIEPWAPVEGECRPVSGQRTGATAERCGEKRRRMAEACSLLATVSEEGRDIQRSVSDAAPEPPLASGCITEEDTTYSHLKYVTTKEK
jgi:hypothetical protein